LEPFDRLRTIVIAPEETLALIHWLGKRARVERIASPKRLKLIKAKKMNIPGRKTCNRAMKILVEALIKLAFFAERLGSLTI
jgi:hypothetical protein